MASNSKVNIIDDEEDPVVSSGGADSLGDTIETVLVKEYGSKDAAILRLFFDEELQAIAEVGLVNCEPPNGPGLKLLIKFKQIRKDRIEQLIKDLDDKLDTIENREVSVPTDAFAKLAEHMRSEEKRLKDAKQKERVLYRPDIVNKKVLVFFWPGNEQTALKLKRELGIIETGGTRNRRTSSDQAEGENPSGGGSHLYPDLKKTVSNDQYQSHPYGRSGSLEQTKTENEYEEMEWEEIPRPKPRPDAFVYDFKGGLKLFVYKASILKLEVDAIVNAANDNMAHGGGVAEVISKAAGSKLDSESKELLKTLPNRLLPVSKNIVTTAGKLTQYRGVIHAVGPQWHESKSRDEKIWCLDDLYETIKNILETCDMERYTTVAMPAISAGIYGVPKELCADMYVKAAAEYSKIPGSRLPNELHIVDIDQEILDLVKRSVHNFEKDPKLLDQRKTVPVYLDNHPPLSSSGRGRGRGRNRGQISQGHIGNQGSGHGYRTTSTENPELHFEDIAITCEVKKLQVETFKWGGVAENYTISKELTVKIFKGDITKSSNVDSLVCGIGSDMQFGGYVAEALKSAGGYDFGNIVGRDILKSKSQKPGTVLKCASGKLKVDSVVFVVSDKLVDVEKKDLETYRMCVYKLLKKANEWKLRRIAVPLFSTGNLQTNENKLQKCAIAFIQALDNFIEKNPVKVVNLKEIHLVNNNGLVTSSLVKVFDAACRSYGHNAAKPAAPKDSGHNKDRRTDFGQGQSKTEHSGHSYGKDSYSKTYPRHSTGKSAFSDSSNNDNSARKDKYKTPLEHIPARPKPLGSTGDGRERTDRRNSDSGGASGGEKYGSGGNVHDKEERSKSPDIAKPEPAKPKPGNLMIIDSDADE